MIPPTDRVSTQVSVLHPMSPSSVTLLPVVLMSEQQGSPKVYAPSFGPTTSVDSVMMVLF